ncbi:helix-turn-helix domain-containing protein [Nocardiopsis ansamitocini]|uniref:Transcriptional regulator n=1 Tax=Nocardiopsis ansamitocini TaxID=1670832 RepID=A0A9W6UHT1_9ACTN|nr:helix-turn-helix transcriptional regulator [Nocardiopsis ansamitocini]GLU46683.1 transcriptional regulator [Nocardiopsis ansamitocini]
MESESPTVALWQLARELVRLREERGLTRAEAARLVEISGAAVGRWESAERVPREKDLKHLLTEYELSEDEIVDLVQLRRQAGKRGWWQPYSLDRQYGTFIGLEADATSIEIYESSWITGLLQTEDYAREAIKGTLSRGAPESIEQQVEARLNRQKRVLSDSGPQVWVIMGEAAVRQLIGGAKVMHAQLEHLLDLMDHPRLTIQVIPYTAGVHVGLRMQSFLLLELADFGLTTVYVEGHGSNLFLESDEDILEHREIFNQLRLAGAGGDIVRSLLSSALREVAL